MEKIKGVNITIGLDLGNPNPKVLNNVLSGF